MRRNQEVYRQFCARINYILGEFPFAEPGKIYKEFGPDGRLHSLNGFAMRTHHFVASYINGLRHGVFADRFGTIIYFYKDVLVPRKYILDPQSLTFEAVMSHPNVEVRRVGCDIYGFERMLKEAKFKVLNRYKDKHGHENLLLETNLRKKDAQEIDLVKVIRVIDTSTQKAAFLQVPPEMKECKEAIAWTLYMSKDE